MTKPAKRYLALSASGLLAACAAQPPANPEAAGFFAGLFHGLIALGAIVVELVYPLRIYAYPNTGWTYDAGFVAGFCFSFMILMIALMPRIGGFLVRWH